MQCKLYEDIETEKMNKHTDFVVNWIANTYY